MYDNLEYIQMIIENRILKESRFASIKGGDTWNFDLFSEGHLKVKE